MVESRQKNNHYDIIIIGAGAAGLTAAIYTNRRALKTLIISKDVGGQAALTTEVENYPAVGLIDGFDLMQKFMADAKKFGAELKSDEVIEIKAQDGDFVVKTVGDEFSASAVILAFGLTPRDLGVPGEDEFKSKGVSYCATCDGPLYKGKDVMVVGGGNSALDAAEFVSRIANKVYLVHRRDVFRGDEILVDRVKKQKNIELILDSAVKEIKGNNTVESVIIYDVDNENETKEIAVQGVFVEVGHIAKTKWLGDLVDYDGHNSIVVNRNNKTKTKGLFAAGDVTDIDYKQIIISGGEGAKAALQAYKYLQTEKGIKGASLDWGTVKK